MDRWFTWQWMWRSRLRLLGVGTAVLAFGGLAMFFAVTRPGPWGKPVFLIIFGSISIMATGGYQVLQALFSSPGAFGDATDRDTRY